MISKMMPIQLTKISAESGGVAPDAFGDEEDHLAAVERRDRQEVEDRQVDAQEAEEVDQLGQTRLGRPVSGLEDQNRPPIALGPTRCWARLRSIA